MTILARDRVADHIVTVAGDLFARQGIKAVGIDLIIAEARIAKATLYRHFRSKEDLVLAYLEERHAAVMASLHEVLRLSDDPRAQLADIFDRLYHKARSPAFRGCAFGLALAEHGEAVRIVAMARMHKEAVAQVLENIARSAGLADAGGVGRHLALIYDGALARRAIFGTPRPMQDARAAALGLFDASPRVTSGGKTSP